MQAIQIATARAESFWFNLPPKNEFDAYERSVLLEEYPQLRRLDGQEFSNHGNETAIEYFVALEINKIEKSGAPVSEQLARYEELLATLGKIAEEAEDAVTKAGGTHSLL